MLIGLLLGLVISSVFGVLTLNWFPLDTTVRDSVQLNETRVQEDNDIVPTEEEVGTFNETIREPDFRDGTICSDFEVEEGDILPEECVNDEEIKDRIMDVPGVVGVSTNGPVPGSVYVYVVDEEALDRLPEEIEGRPIIGKVTGPAHAEDPTVDGNISLQTGGWNRELIGNDVDTCAPAVRDASIALAFNAGYYLDFVNEYIKIVECTGEENTYAYGDFMYFNDYGEPGMRLFLNAYSNGSSDARLANTLVHEATHSKQRSDCIDDNDNCELFYNKTEAEIQARITGGQSECFVRAGGMDSDCYHHYFEYPELYLGPEPPEGAEPPDDGPIIIGKNGLQ